VSVYIGSALRGLLTGQPGLGGVLWFISIVVGLGIHEVLLINSVRPYLKQGTESPSEENANNTIEETSR